MHHPTLCGVAVALLAALPGAQAGLYTKKSPVLQVDARNYDRLINKSIYTSVVEFYAPWCGHCQNLKPAYEKAAKNLEGFAKVAAVNCDDDDNKPLCGSMGVQGFPTLKIVRPKKGGGKPMVQDYQGPRTATAIVDAVVQQINNYVVKIEDKTLDKFLSDKNETAKAILFTEKGTTSTLLKSIAIDFSDVITIGQVRNKETKAVETFGVDKFPTLVLLPGGDAPGIVYDGEMKKEAMVKFLSQAGAPNPESPPAKAKNDRASKASDKSSSKSKAQASSESTSASSEAGAETSTQQAPVIVETALPIPTIDSSEKLIKECLTEKSHTCVLAFVSSNEDERAKKALASLSQLAFKHAQSKRNLFPFYEVPTSNEQAATLMKALDLTGDVEIVAINARRGWWRHYDAADFGYESVESWIDAIRMSEGVKKKLPEGIVAISVEEPSASSDASPEPTPDATGEAQAADDSTESTSTQAADPTGEAETAAEHDEL
ncbi:hypothetical protein VTK26DRAFT_2626 [Humicola hyalothermophila]